MTNIVGTPFRQNTSEVTWRQTTNFAAAIDDDNPYYIDDERPNGLVAHPMFAAVATWPIARNWGAFITGNVDFQSEEVVGKGVHYSEICEIHRLVRPGDTLTINGEIAAVLSHKAGTHLINAYRAVDQEGKPVFTEYIGGMLRGVECIGEDRGKENIPVIPVNKETGNPVWEKTIAIERLRPFIYDGCTNIVAIIHTSREFAHSVGLPDIILQGSAIIAYAVKEIVNTEAGGNPHRVKTISCRFSGMVIPGSNITLQVHKRVAEETGTDIFFEVLNSENKRAIRNGYIRLSSGGYEET